MINFDEYTNENKNILMKIKQCTILIGLIYLITHIEY